MNKFLEITKAWISSINPTEEEQIKANHRINICNDCSSNIYIPLLNLFCCNECGCPLKKKIFSPVEKGGCPLNKW